METRTHAFLSSQPGESGTEGIILDSISVGVAVVNRDLIVLSWNSAMEEISKVGRRDACGRPFFSIFRGYKGEDFRELTIKAISSGEVQEIRNLRKLGEDGEHLILRIKICPLRGGDGAYGRVKRRGGVGASGEAIIGAVIIAEDVTEKAHMGERLRQVERLTAIGEFASGIAHEINNPIGIISAHIERLLERLKREDLTPEECRRVLHIVQDEIARCSRIVRNLLLFSRPLDSHPIVTDISSVVRDIISLVEPQAHSYGVDIRFQCPGDPPDVFVDPGQIRQVFLNICLNAFQAMPQGGSLTITIRRDAPHGGISELDEDGSYVSVSFEDTGEGIAPENLPRIFSPFFTTKPGGTGLGLALSHGIVRGHNGAITVESHPGEGSRFTVWLPQVGGS